MVKKLTLASWGVDSRFPPIAVADRSGPYAGCLFTAVEAGNYNLARTIVQIAACRHVGSTKPGAADDNQIRGVDVCSELADEVHSIDTIRELATEVKCATSPKEWVQNSNINSHVVQMKDKDMMKFFLDVTAYFPVEQNDLRRRISFAWHLIGYSDRTDGLKQHIRATFQTRGNSW
jgi:hypothetical protein